MMEAGKWHTKLRDERKAEFFSVFIWPDIGGGGGGFWGNPKSVAGRKRGIPVDVLFLYFMAIMQIALFWIIQLANVQLVPLV
jgi:hypothetical protein